MTTIVGLDVSDYQAGFDWNAARAGGAAFGIAKCSEGLAGTQAHFAEHWAGIKAAGLARGAYHFSRWDKLTDPTAEAQFFLSRLPALSPGDTVVLDLEASPDGVAGYELSAWALTWLVTVERALGFRPLLYSGYSFAQSYLTDPLLATYGLWIAAYGAACPAPVGPWPMVSMWQRRDDGAYGGMKVDESVFFGSAEQLRAYGKPAPAPVPAASPPPHVSAGTSPESGKARFLITRDMMARSEPVLSAVLWQGGRPQMVNKGAVLEGTGEQTPHWVRVTAGGHPVWVWLQNTRPV